VLLEIVRERFVGHLLKAHAIQRNLFRRSEACHRERLGALDRFSFVVGFGRSRLSDQATVVIGDANPIEGCM
jgi:hypothetical protein